MSEISETALTLFVPLAIGLTAQFSSFAREPTTAEIGSVIDSKPLVVPFIWSWMPTLGRINFVHATNYLLLLGGLILVAAFEGSAVLRNVLGILLVFVWLQLPVFEVGRYAEIREENLPLSLYFHAISTFVVVAYVTMYFTPGKMVEDFDLLSPNLSQIAASNQLLDISVLAMLVIVNVFVFLKLLESDLTPNDDTREVSDFLPWLGDKRTD